MRSVPVNEIPIDDETYRVFVDDTLGKESTIKALNSRMEKLSQHGSLEPI